MSVTSSEGVVLIVLRDPPALSFGCIFRGVGAKSYAIIAFRSIRSGVTRNWSGGSRAVKRQFVRPESIATRARLPDTSPLFCSGPTQSPPLADSPVR